jgi:small-conductance mechanosensitive channel
MRKRLHVGAALALLLLLFTTIAHAQENGPPPTAPVDEELAVPQVVGVDPVRDEAIEQRLHGILEATGRFEDLQVEVEDGVVFLTGQTQVPEHKVWARELALRLEDVAAVVNNINVLERPPWDLTPGMEALEDLWASVIQSLPIVAFSLLVLLFTWTLALAAAWATGRIFRRRIETPLLRAVAARIVAAIVMILGVYIVLRVANLTGLAATVMGGTGLVGIIIGIAFRDIAENFLASLLISIQKPFRTGDTVQIIDCIGVVERVTTRGTVLMGFDGNYLQIPNALVYKNVIVNITANVNTRLDFIIGIGYDNRISKAQEIALGVLRDHPAILDDPEAMVLVESLGASTIDLRVYFWIDTTRHSFLKVKSAAMRLVVRAFQEAGISLPDSAREVVFPQGVPLVREAQIGPQRPGAAPAERDTSASATEAEGNLSTEVDDLRQQIEQSRRPEKGRDLLAPENE